MRYFLKYIIFVICLLPLSSVLGQTYFTSTEWGIAMGASQYFGNLNQNYGFRTITPAGGIYMRKHMNPYISLKVVANYTQVSYDDKFNSDPYEQERNLNFKSPVAELLGQAEFNFFKFITGDAEYRWTPYLTIGLGAFYYNPYTFLNGEKYYLRPLGTEGQYAGYSDRKYGSVAGAIPIGMGMKYWLKAGINVSFEIADRLTTTHYLDDVSNTYVGANNFVPGSPAFYLQNRTTDPNSTLGEAGKQRGNTFRKDQYMMALLSISWHFITYKCPAYMSQDLIKTY